MRACFDSLRVRLALAMSALFAAGCVVSSLADMFGSAFEWSPILIQEPYQDLLLLVLFGCFCIPFIWIISAWSLKGVAVAAREAHAICITDPSSRIALDRLPTEIRPLVSAVNSAMDRVGHAYDVERRFVADAAHQLRTPLTVLGLRLQKARMDESIDWDRLDADLAVMTRLAEQLLALSKKQSARHTRVPSRPVDFARIAREAAAAIAPIIESEGRTIDVDIRSRVLVDGRADDLREMIACLLDNAVVHGKGEISLCVELMSDVNAMFVRLVVSDRGPGVDLKIGMMAFDRFRKGPGPGSGLGLAIVKEVVEGHDGRISIMPAPGCRIEVLLPMLPESRGRFVLPCDHKGSATFRGDSIELQQQK